MTVSSFSFPCPLSFGVYDGYRMIGLQGFLSALSGKEVSCLCFLQEYIRVMRSILVKATLLFLISGCMLIFPSVTYTANAQAGALPRVAVFDFEMINTSSLPITPAEDARLKRLGETLRKRLAESGLVQVVDIGPVEEAARASNLQFCGGCDGDLAMKVGAQLSITGTVQKVSDLILNENIYLRDAASGKMLAVMSADMRGNTDETWSRALVWLLRYRLIPDLEMYAAHPG
jgi:Protein of unknown function (DUF2380)